MLPWCEKMVIGVLCSFQRCSNIRSASFVAFIVSLHGAKSAMLLSWLIIVKITLNRFETDGPVIKSEMLSVHGPAGTGSGLSVHNGFCVTKLNCWHRFHPYTYLFTYTVSDSQVKLWRTIASVFFWTGSPSRLLSWKLFRMSSSIRFPSGTSIEFLL